MSKISKNKPAAAPAQLKVQPGTTPSTSASEDGIANVHQSDRVSVAAGREQEIICPVLRALVNEGRVAMDRDGTVRLTDLRAAVENLGATPTLGAVTWGIGAVGNKLTDIFHNLAHGEFNVKELPEGIVPHAADTGILRNGKFDEQRFQALIAHAENGVMTVDSFAEAIKANARRDMGENLLDVVTRGVNFAQLEFTGLLAVFAKRDAATGKKGIAVDDLRTLYQHGRIPQGMLGDRATLVEATILQATLAVKVDPAVAGYAFRSLLTATGLSQAGARLSEGAVDDKAVAQQASIGAGKSSSCPYLNGSARMPAAPADVINAHTSAGMTS